MIKNKMMTFPLASLFHGLVIVLLSALGIEETHRPPALTRVKAVRLSAQRNLAPMDPFCDTKGREGKFCLRQGKEGHDWQLQGVCSPVRSESANVSSSLGADAATSSGRHPTCPKDQLPHCDSMFLDAGVRLARDDDCLNGPESLVADDFLTQEECGNLLKLSESAIQGSGYGKVFPMTKYETFSGVTAKDLVQRLKDSTIDASVAKLMLLASERTRLYVEAYFRLKRRLYTHYVHLACRNATEDSTTDRSDMSHIVHSDNCQFQQNGSCPVLLKHIACRNYSAAIYLNDDVLGGEMVLATTPRTSIRAVIPPKCGRMVALNSRNPHGVLPVFRGRRCALLTWMTYEKHMEDPSLQPCRRMLGFADEDGYLVNASLYR